MEIGLVLQADPPARRVIELTRRGEDAGMTHAWTFDSHLLWQEPFVIYSQMLAATSSMMVGPMVTNPGTRHPTVTASLFATLNEMFGNRTVCGIGRGDSARRVLGLPPTDLTEVERTIHVIRELAEGREVVGDNGTPWVIPWVGDAGLDSRLEVWMAAYGPKALAVCGRVADGFILQLADPYLVEWTVRAVRDAAVGAGRDPDDLTICVAAPAYVGDDIAHQRDQTRWFGGMVGNHVADLVRRYGEDSDMVPAALTDYISGRAGYDYSHHGKSENRTVGFVPDEVIDRFCVLGPAAAHVDRIEELRSLGVDQFAVYLMHDDPDGTLDAYRDTVVPAITR
jgi:probable F420-dependent oxidoreductase